MRKRTKRNLPILRVERKCDFIIALLTAREKATELDNLIEHVKNTAAALAEQARADLLKGYGK